MGQRIVYESDPPRVQIWTKEDFDKFRKKGRFGNIDREELNFSTKIDNEASEESEEEITQEIIIDSFVQLVPSAESMDVDNSDIYGINLEHQTLESNSEAARGRSMEAENVPDSAPSESITQPDCEEPRAVQRQRIKVENSVKQLTKDSSSALNHSNKLKEASVKLNQLRNSNIIEEISLDQILQDIQNCDTGR